MNNLSLPERSSNLLPREDGTMVPRKKTCKNFSVLLPIKAPYILPEGSSKFNGVWAINR